ncbi:hypothetical protein O3G_MSEX010413 [Manduca sexta]|uniref:Uncharacterized protein n=1 Tax=Manduca sexta TaxID=7130 RepID=A0A921ZII2_MANSE|nr:hypothetical protein O3G_MSEX010413 [Manduca sexta]
MLINRVSEVNDRGDPNTDRVDDHNQDYQTASDLFDIMSKNHNLNVTGALTPSDLVLLYKNLDVGVNLVSESTITPKRNNQHIETVVYEDGPDSDDSDISEIYNTDDVNVYDCNKERLDILNNGSSCGNSLCQKLGGIEIQSSNIKDYHQYFNIFQDPLIKDQLNYNLGFENCDGAVLPATLLDYICCKRLEDNYNFYMDNIIRYVKHTIEQLKRISNGDYLTDKAKEKWREVGDPVDKTNNTKILATSTSIPLHIERKRSNHMSAWDDIVHSEVDVRSLSKILEKKIIVEVPKLICGTYKLFSRRCADNLIISCKRENDPIEEENEGPRVDVVLQLEKSQSGHVVSNISSIMVLKTNQEICAEDSLSLPYKDVEDSFFDAKDGNSRSKLQIVEIKPNDDNCLQLVPKTTQGEPYGCKDNYFNDEESRQGTHDTNEYPCSENDNVCSKNHSFLESSESNDAFKDIPDDELDPQPGTSFNPMLTEDLQLTMRRFNLPSSLPEESVDDVSQNTLNKKKSPTRIRIKSPYENQSHLLEEKKRRRLLEIREKRERKKLALGENCKISKHKYARGGILPQASSSVTKLSITNKSFYNSIYGQTVVDQSKNKNRKGGKNDAIPEVPLDHEGEHDAQILTPDTKKYINRSYYLDDTETEMLYMDMKKNEISEIKACSASTSVESSDFRANLTLLSQLIGPSVTDLNGNVNQAISEEQTLSPNETSVVDAKDNVEPIAIVTTKSIINLAPANTPKHESTRDINDQKKPSSSVECRKSIDKIYDLMKKLENGDGDEEDVPKPKLTSAPTDRVDTIGRRVSSTIQGSDSGTSLKHRLTSSNPSCFSFEKTNIEIPKLKTLNKGPEIPVVPKVIISNKVQIIKPDGEKSKKPKRSITSPTVKTQDNPLKAISQLLHEFDNVQKCRQKTGDLKPIKKHEITSNDVKSISCQGSSKRRSRLELHFKETEVLERPKVTSPRKLKTSLGLNRNARQPIISDDNHNKLTKRKINDIIDEVKEARGEAVKGPSKFYSRLNSLAQPKKSYVQARIDEHPIRAVKAPPEKPQKLALAPLLSERNVGSTNTKNKLKGTGTEATSSVCIKQPPVQPIGV